MDKDANIIYFNEAVCRILDRKKSDVLNQNLLTVFPNVPKSSSSFFRVLETKKPALNIVHKLHIVRKKPITFVTSTYPVLDKNDDLVGAIEIFEDITNIEHLSNKVFGLQKELFKKNSSDPIKTKKSNGTRYYFEDIIYKSLIMNELILKTKIIANSDSPVLIYGETGTGKELLVQAIHNSSSVRINHPFIAQNCAAIPSTLLESILFGTTAGSFTSAQNKPGLFELANNGTLFLDEINSMDLELQAKLLRVLQEGVVRRIGANDVTEVNVRVVASTNEDPQKLLEENKIRKDLFYRLNVISFTLPPLRERIEDIDLLVTHFITCYNKKFCKKVSGISNDVRKKFYQYSWPGNIRELRYTLENIMNFIQKDTIEIEDLPQQFLSHIESDTLKPNTEDMDMHTISPLNEYLATYEIDLIQKAIKKANGNRAKAARLLNINKQTLYNKIKKYDISWKITTE